MARAVERRFLTFVGLTATWAWSFWLLTIVLPDSIDIAAVLVGAWGPTVAAVVVTAGGFGFLFVAGYVLAVPTLRRLPAIGDIETLSV